MGQMILACLISNVIFYVLIGLVIFYLMRNNASKINNFINYIKDVVNTIKQINDKLNNIKFPF